MSTIFTLSRCIRYSLFLFPALLLWTANYSVIVAVFFILYSIFYCCTKKITFTQVECLILAIFSSYFIANIPNTIIDTGQLRYIEAPVKILSCFAVYLMLKEELKRINVLPWLEYGVFIGSLGALAIALIQFFLFDFPRVNGFLFSINFGYLACSLAFLNLSLLPASPRKICLSLGFIVSIIATMLTFTRGAIIAIPFLSIVFLFLYKNELNKKWLIAAFIIGSSLIFSSYYYSNSVKNRVDYTVAEIKKIYSGDLVSAPSAGGRIQLWLFAIKAFKQSPLLGLTYPEREELADKLYQDKQVTKWLSQISRTHAHSQYFEMLSSTGVLGIAAIFLMLGGPLIIFIKNRYSHFARCGIIFITGIAIFALTEVLLQANLISFYFGIMLAFFLAATQADSELHLKKPNIEKAKRND